MSARQEIRFDFAVAPVGSLLLVCPVYRKAAIVDRRSSELLAKCRNYSDQADEIVRLRADLEAAREFVQRELKTVPESPDIAGLMRVLSLPVDGVNIRDQTFTAGQPKRASADPDITTLAMPLTVDMEARFEVDFSLIQGLESMDRLLRIASVSMRCEKSDQDVPFAKASVVLEAIYSPPASEEVP